VTKKKRKPRAGLLGVGLDNEDGHKRITQGEQFILVGGSEETHERMTETVVKTFEELKRRDRQLEEVEPKELADILKKSSPK
jgi:heptaprenylglyceryl phosphate synthase